MSISRLIMIIFLSAAVVSAGYCRSASEGNVSDGIEFTITSEKSKYAVDGRIVVNLELKNVSNKEINLFFSKCPVEFLKVYIYNEEGEEIYKTEESHIIPCSPSSTTLYRLKPGESYRDTHDISHIVERIIPENGVYQIVCTYSVPDHWEDLKDVGSNYWKTIVRSGKLPLYIVNTYTTKEVSDIPMKMKIADKLRDLFGNRAIEVKKIEEIGDLNVFQNYRLLRIYVTQGDLLENADLADGTSYGMFAYHDDTLLYLNRSNKNLENILWEERHGSVRDMSPKDLAQVLILCKLSEQQTRNQLIRSNRDVYNFEKKKDLRGYVVHRGRLNRHKGVIAPPRWRNAGRFEELTFFALSGWMHQITNLVKITVLFDKDDSAMTIDEYVLEPRVFKRTPKIAY